AAGNGGNPAVDTVLAALETQDAAPELGRLFVDPVADTATAGEVAFLNQLIGPLADAIYGDEFAGALGVPGGSRGRASPRRRRARPGPLRPPAGRASHRGPGVRAHAHGQPRRVGADRR